MGIISAPLLWLIMGVMLLLLELALPGFVLFFFALGALITSGVAYFFHIPLNWQLALFIVASLLSLLSLRNVIQRKFFQSPADGEEEDEDVELAIAGERGVVSATIKPPAEGRIKYSGSFWRARADETIEEGEIISIVSRDGLVIHVEKV